MKKCRSLLTVLLSLLTIMNSFVFAKADTDTKSINVISGKLPIAYIAVNSGAASSGNPAYNWSQIRYGGENEKNFAYDINDPNLDGMDEVWAPYVTNLTDENESTGLFIYPERHWVQDDIIAIYEISDSVIDGMEIKFKASSIGKSIDVYASQSRETLFAQENLICEITTSGTTAKNSSPINKRAKYVAFAMTFPEYTVTELSVYGQEIQYKNIDLNKGLSPVALYPVTDGGTDYVWRNIMVGSGASQLVGYGVGKPESAPQSIASIADFTDRQTDTKLMLHNEGFSHDIALVYKLNSASEVSKVNVSALENDFGVDVYLSKSYAALFRSDNLDGHFDAGANKTEINIEVKKKAVYVGIIFRVGIYSGVTVSEIQIIGNLNEKKEKVTTSSLFGTITPTNKNANESARALYQYLNNVGKSDKMLIGAHMNSESSTLVHLSDENNYYAFLEKTYGVNPAVFSTSYGEFDIEFYKQYYDEGAIPLICCADYGALLSTFKEIRAENEYATDYMGRYLDKTYVPTVEEAALANAAREEFWSKMVIEADFFEELEAAGVDTYMASPFNEMNIKAFYGDNYMVGTQYFINLWRQLYDYFVNERGLKGILFVFRPSAFFTEHTLSPIHYYPGNDYVDIIAPTIYSFNDDGVLPEIDDYDELIATGKPFGLAETGTLHIHSDPDTSDCLNLLNSLKTTYNKACFASLWFGHRLGINNHLNDKEFITDDYFLTLDTMLDYRNNPKESGVRFYTNSMYAGLPFGVTCGSYNVSVLSNDKIKSFIIDDGYKITVYAGENCTGKNMTFGRSVNDVSIFGFDFASFKVECTGVYIVADINSDGKNNIIDLIRMKKSVIGLTHVKINELAADIDNNGIVDALDLISLRKLLLKN